MRAHRDLLPRCMLVLGAFALYAAGLFTPLFGADIDWRTGSPSAIAFADLPLRWLSSAVVLIVACCVAALVKRLPSGRAGLTLALALASPLAWRMLLFVSNLIPLLVTALVVSALLAVSRRRSWPLAGALGALCIGAAALGFQIDWTAAAWHAAWLGLSAIAGGVASRVLPRSVVPRALMSVIVLGVAAGAAMTTAAWLDGIALAALSVRAVHGGADTGELLLLNAPSGIRVRAATGGQAGDMAAILPGILPERASVGQIIDGSVGAPGALNAFAALYSEQIRRYSQDEARVAALERDSVVLGANVGGRFVVRRVGGKRAPSTQSQPPVAVFSQGDGRVTLHGAWICRMAPGRYRLHLDVFAEGVALGTAKFFRHALAGATQVAGNDVSLFGGLLELQQGAGRALYDESYFDLDALAEPPDAARVGVYDWQSGQRWLAARSDGSQWPENAVVIPLLGDCPRS